MSPSYYVHINWGFGVGRCGLRGGPRGSLALFLKFEGRREMESKESEVTRMRRRIQLGEYSIANVGSAGVN